MPAGAQASSPEIASNKPYTHSALAERSQEKAGKAAVETFVAKQSTKCQTLPSEVKHLTYCDISKMKMKERYGYCSRSDPRMADIQRSRTTLRQVQSFVGSGNNSTRERS